MRRDIDLRRDLTTSENLHVGTLADHAFGDKRVDDATALYQQAADCAAVDAMECLDIEQAKAELE